jgi:tetratricopeptide (TPR) repeat protein
MAEIAPAVDLDRDHPQRRGPQTVEAYEAYLRGRYYWNTRSEESIHKAIDHFNRALELDPLYAPAYTGLADALATLGDMLYLMPSKDAFAKAEAASLRALQMDPSQAEAHATLGHLRMHAWRWEDAEREFQQAIAIDPGYASAHHWRAFNLASVGRLDEAVASIETAQRLDPLSLIINADVAQVLYFARRYDEAIAQSRKTLQMNAGFQEARRILFLSLQRMHHDQEALKELEAFYRSPDGGPGASTGYAFAMLGRRARARAVLGQQESHSERQFVPPYNLAVIHAGLGDVDRAFALLDESVTRNDTESMILPVDPRLDALRRDPRYAALLRRMGLPRS